MVITLAMCSCLMVAPFRQVPSPDRWFAPDKVKHFFTSAFIQSASFSVARAAGMSRSSAMVAASVSTVTFSVGKEGVDRRRARQFSFRDLVWDGAGALSAAALLNGTR